MKKTISLEMTATVPFLNLEISNVFLKNDKLIVLSKISQGSSKNRLSCAVEPLFASITVELPDAKLPLEYPIYHIIINGGLAKSPDENKVFKAINDIADLKSGLVNATKLKTVIPEVDSHLGLRR